MTSKPTSSEAESGAALREQILGEVLLPNAADIITAVIKDGSPVIDPFDFVEPCEENCTKERHAYHQGQWDMAGRMSAALQNNKKEAV